MFSDQSICVAYLGFYTLLHFEHQVFLGLDNVLSYYKQGHIKKPKQVYQQKKYCLPFHLFKCVIHKEWNLIEQVATTVKKPNHSPRQNVVATPNEILQRLLLSFWQFFGQHVDKANWKILRSPWHFIADILSTWISKGCNIKMIKTHRKSSTGDTVCVVILCSDTKVPIKVNILNHEKNGPKGHKKPVAGRKP